MTLPIIHSNGTGAETLMEENLAARNAIEDALRIIQKMEFNARDYYPVDGAWEKAKAERLVHQNALRAASEHFLAIAEHASDAIAAKEKR